MKKIIVPKSVRKTVVFAFIKRFILLLLYLVIAYVFIDYVLASMYADANMGNLSFTVFVFLVIPFVLSGIPVKFFDRDWYGEIISVDLKNAEPKDIDNHSKAAISQTALIKAANGKLYKRKIFDEGALFYNDRENVYNVGDKVIHVYGTDYLMPIRTIEKNKPTVCVVCGNKSPLEKSVCRCCGCSLEIRLDDGDLKK